MRRIAALISAFLLAGSVCGVAAVAQEDYRVEILAGGAYPFASSDFDIDNQAGATLSFGVRATERFVVGVRYDVFSTEDDLDFGGDADLTFYGVTGTVVLNDEPALQLLGILSAGMGELEYANPNPPDPVLVDNTDISFWYEAAVAAQFKSGRRWIFRLQLGARRVEPDMPSVLLRNTRTIVMPTFQVGLRF